MVQFNLDFHHSTESMHQIRTNVPDIEMSRAYWLSNHNETKKNESHFEN